MFRASLLTLLLAASPALARTAIVWSGGVGDVENSTFRDLTISTSPTAYVTLTSHIQMFKAEDGANVAALFADMTNGVNNPLTIGNGTFEYTVDEDYFFTDRGEPLVTYMHEHFTLPRVDLAGWTINYIWAGQAVSRRKLLYYFAVYASVPEPSAAALLSIAGLVTLAIRRR